MTQVHGDNDPVVTVFVTNQDEAGSLEAGRSLPCHPDPCRLDKRTGSEETRR